MKIELVKYTSVLEKAWDDFIDNNKRNATFLHSRKFFNHNVLNETDDCSLLFYKNNKIVSVLPATLYIKEDKLIFHSHLRSTYGGFVTSESVGVEEAIKIVEATIDFAKSNKVNEIIIRNPFRIFHQLPSDETDYAMWYHGFKIKYRELECSILLDEILESRYDDGTKRSIKKASKQVVVKHSEKFEEYWQVLTGNLQKYKTLPVHNLDQILKLRSLVGKDKIKLVVAELDGTVIGGVLLFILNTAIHAQYIASDTNFQNIRPMNAVIDYIINWAKNENYKYFNLGMANENAGKEINYGLFKFKEGFGARGTLRETMHLILN